MSGNVAFRRRSPADRYREKRKERFEENRYIGFPRKKKVILGKVKKRRLSRFGPVSKELLLDFYVRQGSSIREIAEQTGFSPHKISYWMEGYKIKKRTISEAIYKKRNPGKDPFRLKEPDNLVEAMLMGMGLGLYWGEGTKANKNSIRLGNTDPALIRTFILFLMKCFNANESRFHFGLQIFSDIDPREALRYWIKELHVDRSQFQKVVVTPSRGAGTYRKKMKYGVLTVYFNNKKLREAIIRKLRDFGYSGE